MAGYVHVGYTEMDEWLKGNFTPKNKCTFMLKYEIYSCLLNVQYSLQKYARNKIFLV